MFMFKPFKPHHTTWTWLKKVLQKIWWVRTIKRPKASKVAMDSFVEDLRVVEFAFVVFRISFWKKAFLETVEF